MTLNIATMTDDELQDVINANSSARDELQKRKAKKNAELRKEIRQGIKFKKLAAKYKKALERIKALDGKQEITLTIPIKFTVVTEVYDEVSMPEGECYELTEKEVFDYTVEAEVLSSGGINKKQAVLLQEGVEGVIADSCDLILGILPTLTKDRAAAVVEYNKVMVEARNSDLFHEDFDEENE